MTEPETQYKKIGTRFPCCGKASTHQLDIDVPRDLTCTPCGMTFTATMTPCDQRTVAMAGRPVAKVTWTFKSRTETRHGSA